MKSTTTSKPTLAPAAAPSVRGRWARFLAGLLVILLFAFGVVPALQRLGPVREVREAIQERGIDATALIYTESDVAGDAEASLRNALRYSPRHTQPPAQAGEKAAGESR
ncbi:MAG: hypothetical protein HQ582_19875 [Planctomycetes bacterium]|nr:hypothetical protein [Planctomycetota bacterium]